VFYLKIILESIISANFLLAELTEKSESLNKCKHCGIDFEEGITDFCSKECVSLYFDGEIKRQ